MTIDELAANMAEKHAAVMDVLHDLDQIGLRLWDLEDRVGALEGAVMALVPACVRSA